VYLKKFLKLTVTLVVDHEQKDGSIIFKERTLTACISLNKSDFYNVRYLHGKQRMQLGGRKLIRVRNSSLISLKVLQLRKRVDKV
jgi:hypothetical protein